MGGWCTGDVLVHGGMLHRRCGGAQGNVALETWWRMGECYTGDMVAHRGMLQVGDVA